MIDIYILLNIVSIKSRNCSNFGFSPSKLGRLWIILCYVQWLCSMNFTECSIYHLFHTHYIDNAKDDQCIIEI